MRCRHRAPLNTPSFLNLQRHAAVSAAGAAAIRQNESVKCFVNTEKHVKICHSYMVGGQHLCVGLFSNVISWQCEKAFIRSVVLLQF